jgi:hypothetical protein
MRFNHKEDKCEVLYGCTKPGWVLDGKCSSVLPGDMKDSANGGFAAVCINNNYGYSTNLE